MKHLKLKSFFLTLLLACAIGQTWADIRFVVGVTDNGTTGGSDYDVMKLNVNFEWDGTDKGWIQHNMSKAGITFEGKALYIDYMEHTDAAQTKNFQFQKYDGTTQKYTWNAYAGRQTQSDWANYIVDYGGSKYSKMTMQYGRVYFDASNWSETDIKLVIGHANFQRYYGMTNVTGTKLYYYYLNLNDAWTDAMGCGVVGNTTASDGTNWLTNVSSEATEYTGFNHFQLNNNGENIRYLIVNNGNTGEQPTMNYSSDYTDLNSTQTYNTVVKTIGGSYTSGNSKSTINISSYELTSQGGTTNRTTSITTAACSTTVAACRTATTQLQVGTPATGYRFDGWYTAATSGSLVSNSTNYMYYPTSANTYYARFSEIAHTVTVAYKCGGTSIKSNASVANVGVTTAQNTTAPTIEGYTFSSWSEMPSGVTTSSSLTGSTISINATAASKTITANYTLNSHTLTWDLDGGTVTTAGTCADAAATGTPNGSVNYGASITAPVVTKAGYTFAGWDVTPASTMPDNDLTYTAQWTPNPYSVTITPNNVTKETGSTGSSATAHDQVYTATFSANTGYNLPSDVTVTINGNTATKTTDYTWSEGTLTILANKIDGDVTITVNGVAKTYTEGTLDKKGGSSDGVYSVTYNATSINIDDEPEYAGYQVAGYYIDEDRVYLIAYPNGNLVESSYKNTTPVVSDHHWIYDGTVTLYTQWEPKSYTITLDANRGGIPGTDGSENFTAKSGASDYSSRTMPTREGYTFAGYWTDPSSGVQVLTAPNGGIKADVSGYTDEDGKWTNTDDDLTLYAHWTNNGTYVFKGGASGNETSWSTAANWTKGVAPSANDGSENIIILAPVEIPASATTNVNSVRIGSAGSYTLADGTTTIDAAGKLTIPATAMLKVTTNVQNYNVSTSTESATTTSTLHIKSASSGNGALVWGTSGTPGRAQVDFYTKSSAAGNWEGANTDVNQYIGTPFSDANVLYNYYNAWTFKVNDAGTAWERLKGNETMYPFVGYDVIYDGAAGHIFQMDGTLVTNENRSLSASNATESVLANSWVAPIKIAAFEVGDFDGLEATIYIFNSTSEDLTGDKTTGVGEGGNYSAYTLGTAGETDVIPSMQSFSVSGGTGTVSLNYTKLVKTPASHSLIGTMHAPRRFADGETEPEENLEPKMDFLRLRVADTNGWADELKIYIREDFVEEFENGFDARKMYGDDRAPMLYGISPDGRMAINCIPTADNHVLGFHAGSASNEYTFRFTYDGEDELYLRDNKTGIETPITAEDTYTFTSESGDSDLRFSIIRKVPATPTDLEELTGETLQDSGVQKIMYNGKLYIIRGGRIYDATGAVVK